MNEDLVIFENHNFWKDSIKYSIAKRMIKRGYDYSPMIEDVCNLSSDEVERIIQLNDSFISQFDLDNRLNFIAYFRSHKYEDWEVKSIFGITESEFFEIFEGKGQSYRIDFENMTEEKCFESGESIANNIALVEMINLKYPKKEIIEILGSYETQYTKVSSIFNKKDLIDKIAVHLRNKGIKHRRNEILLNLLKFENNIGNASIITGMGEDEINDFISNNSIFLSNNDLFVFDEDLIKKEKNLSVSHLLIEVLVIEGIEEYQIEDYSKILDIDSKSFKKIYDTYILLKEELYEIQEDCALKLFDRKLDLYEVEEIVGITNLTPLAPSEYFFNKFKSYLDDDYREAYYGKL